MQLPTYAIARAGSVTYTPVHGNIGALTWARPGIEEPMSSWILIGFSPLSHDRNSYLIFKWSFARAICPYFSDSFKTHLYKNKQCHIVLIWLFCVILVEYSFGFFFLIWNDFFSLVWTPWVQACALSSACAPRRALGSGFPHSPQHIRSRGQ